MQRIINSCSQAIKHANSRNDPGNGGSSILPREIRAIRERLEVTQRQFAEIYGFDLNCLKSWESGRRNPDRGNRLLLTLVSLYPTEMRELVARCQQPETTSKSHARDLVQA